MTWENSQKRTSINIIFGHSQLLITFRSVHDRVALVLESIILSELSFLSKMWCVATFNAYIL